MSLRMRILVALLPLFVIALVAADVGTYASLQSFLLQRVDTQLLTSHQSLEASLEGQDRGPGGPGRGGPPTAFPPGTYAELRTPGGTLVRAETICCGPDPTTTYPRLPATLSPGTVETPALLTVEGAGEVSEYRVFVDTSNNGSGDIFVVAFPLSDVSSTLTQLLRLEAGITGGLTLLLAGAVWLIVRRSLRPLERMGATARSIVASGLSQRVEPATERTEVGRLGLALNTMLGELEAAFAARTESERRLRNFVSDASHELRTPLTSMRGYAELFRRNPHMDEQEITLAMRRIEDETRRMGVLVDDLLLLARLDQGRPLDSGPVELATLVGDAAADARAADPSRAITTEITAPLVVLGDEMRLRQVLGNLVRNALVHTPAGTPVEVSLGSVDGSAVVEVVDHGPGIPAGEAERVFERFHRADAGRSRDRGGSGLGLSIVAAVVAAHGGRVSALPTPGGGATLRIELPLPADP